MKQIKTWSFSRLSDFEKCRYRAKLKYLDHVPEPPRPLPPGKSEHANDRGTRVHEAAEAYVRGGVELVSELAAYKERYDELRELYAVKKVTLEGEWAFDRQWTPVGWNSHDAWCRMKLDAFVQVTNDHARVIDYKTGRKFGNEIKHTEQGQLYQLAAFLKFPQLASVDVEFWYIDQGLEHDTRVSYSRAQGTAYYNKFYNRGAALTEAVEFPPNPNAYSCKWCPYLGNVCEYGVSADIIKASDKIKRKRSGLAGVFAKG